MPASFAGGPERITLTEMLVGLFRLPYALGCLALTILIGFPGSLLASYLDTMSVERAFTLAISYGGFTTVPSGSESPLQGIARVVLYNAFLFISIYATRSLRRRIVSAEAQLSPLSPKGEQGFHEAFGSVSSLSGAVVLWFLFSVSYALPRVLTSEGTFTRFFSATGSTLNALVLAAAFWVYFSGQWGLRKFGNADIQLKSYSADRMFGLRSLGSISIFFGVTFLVLIGVALLGSLLANDPLNMGITIILLSLGVAMLFLPLNGVHRKMAEMKRREQAALQEELREAIVGPGGSSGNSVESHLEGISRLMRAQLRRDEVSSLPTWPFETRVVERLAAVMIAVITIVLARLLQIALKL